VLLDSDPLVWSFFDSEEVHPVPPEARGGGRTVGDCSGHRSGDTMALTEHGSAMANRDPDILTAELVVAVLTVGFLVVG